MAGGGLTARNNARKMYTNNAKKSKYTAILETPEMLREKELKAQAAATLVGDAALTRSKAMEVETTVDDLTKMTEKMKVSKKKKASEDIEMNAMPKISLKSKSIAKAQRGSKDKRQCKKQKAQSTF